MSDGGADVEDKWQHLGEDDAVEDGGGDAIAGGEVADDGGAAPTGRGVENVGANDAGFAEAVGVSGVADFERAAADVVAMPLEEGFDVIAVDRRATVVAEGAARWAWTRQNQSARGRWRNGGLVMGPVSESKSCTR
jgi:hypothetical protein